MVTNLSYSSLNDKIVPTTFSTKTQHIAQHIKHFFYHGVANCHWGKLNNFKWYDIKFDDLKDANWISWAGVTSRVIIWRAQIEWFQLVRHRFVDLKGANWIIWVLVPIFFSILVTVLLMFARYPARIRTNTNIHDMRQLSCFIRWDTKNIQWTGIM